MKIKPINPKAVIRDPHSRLPLPAEGADVPDDSTFWNRRLIDGDVARVAAPAATESAESVAPLGNEPIAPLTTRGRS